MTTYSEISTVNYSGDIRVDSLLDDSTLSWNYILPTRTTLYYTFETSVIGTKASGVTGFNAAQSVAARALLSYASSVTGISFAEVASGSSADFHFGNTNVAGSTTAGLTRTAWSYSQTSGGILTSYSADAFVFLDNVEFASTNVAPAPGNSGYEILLHEIGHALGLGHPFDALYPLPAGQDNTNNSVMSYTHMGAAKSTFQSHDLLALRWIFGEDGLGGAFGYNSANGSSLTLGEPANRAPIAAADAFVTAEDIVLSGNVLANDSDPDAQPITAGVVSLPAHGTLTLQANGQFSYVPATNFSGVDSFVYRASDASVSASASVTLTVTAVNDAPVAFGTVVSVIEDTPISSALPVASDIDGDALRYAKGSNPAHGTVSIASSGQYTYTPVSQFAGTDSFTYTVTDGTLSSSATVNLVIAGVNDAPASTAASIVVDEDTRANGRLPAASDPEGALVTYSKASGPSHGAVTIDGSGQYTYVPAANYIGGDAFAFRVSDPAGASSAYVVAVTVRGVVDEVVGTLGNDTLSDTSGDAHLSGLAGHDRMQGGSGNDTLDGGPGIDIAVYAQPASGYRVARFGTGWQVTDKQGADGVDALTDTERLEFADKSFELVKPAVAGTPAYGALDNFLFDPVYYLLEYDATIPTDTLAAAWPSYAGSGAAQHLHPTSWFDASYYGGKWSDLGALNLDDLSLFRHFNLFGVWEGRAPGPAFDRFDPNAYLSGNPDVAAYIDAHLSDFLGSRTNGAIAHFILYGEAEGRAAFDLAGQGIRLDYVVDLIG